MSENTFIALVAFNCIAIGANLTLLGLKFAGVIG